MKYLKWAAVGLVMAPVYLLVLVVSVGAIGGTIVAAGWVWWTALHAASIVWNVAAVLVVVWALGIAATFVVTTVRS